MLLDLLSDLDCVLVLMKLESIVHRSELDDDFLCWCEMEFVPAIFLSISGL